MELEVRDSGDVAVLDLCGKLTRGDGDELLRVTVDGLLAAGRTRLLLNLAQVPYMDSMGIGALLSVRARAVTAGGSAKLLNPLKRVYDVLQLVKLDSVFETYQDEGLALASFGANGQGSPR